MIQSLFQGNFSLASIIDLLISFLIFVCALSIHEWAHAFVAHKMGDDTARNMGRMTLNPLAHLDPLGTLGILLLGFGWAKPVPVNPNNYRNKTLGNVLVSLAGITCNILLALITAIVFVLLIRFNVIKNTSTWLPIILAMLIQVNVVLCVFNLLPIPPLDGYGFFKEIFRKVIPLNFFWQYERISSFVLIGFLLLSMRIGIINSMSSWVMSGLFKIAQLFM